MLLLTLTLTLSIGIATPTYCTLELYRGTKADDIQASTLGNYGTTHLAFSSPSPSPFRHPNRTHMSTIKASQILSKIRGWG